MSSSSSLSGHTEMDESDKLDVASNKSMDANKAEDVPLPLPRSQSQSQSPSQASCQSASQSQSQSVDRAHLYDDAHMAVVTNGGSGDTALNRSSDEMVKSGTSSTSSDQLINNSISTHTKAEVETVTHIRTGDDNNHQSQSQATHSDVVTTTVSAMTTMTTMLTMMDSPLACIEKLPNDILLYMANEFLTDYETVQFAHGSLDLFHRLRHYDIKYIFKFDYLVHYKQPDWRYFQLNVHQRLDKHVPSYNARQRWQLAQSWYEKDSTLQTTPNYHLRIGRMNRVKVTPKSGIGGPFDFSLIPNSVQHIIINRGYTFNVLISMKEMKDLLARDLVSFAHQGQCSVHYNQCFVKLTSEEYAGRHRHEPLQLPSSLRHFVMPIFFVGESYESNNCIEVDPSHFITLPPSLTYLQTSPSAYSYKLILPDTLHTLYYGGGRQGTHGKLISRGRYDNDCCGGSGGGGGGGGGGGDGSDNGGNVGSTEWSQWPKLPRGLKVLILSQYCQSPLQPLAELPPGLTEIKLECNLPLDSITSVAVASSSSSSSSSAASSSSSSEVVASAAASSWPMSLTNLILPESFGHPLSDLTLPPSVTSLRLRSWAHLNFKELAPVRFPPSLKHLSCHIYEQSLEYIKLPEGLTSLDINGYYYAKHLPRVYPSTLTHLRLHSRWKTSFSLPTLSNLTSLSLSYDPNMKLDAFPSVTQLTILCWRDTHFKSTCNSQLNLPPRLTTFTIASSSCRASHAFEISFVADISWPESLTTIRFHFMRVDLQTFKPPPWVTHLIMPYVYTSGDQGWSTFRFPTQLQQLSIGSDEVNHGHLTQITQPMTWPSSLTHLKLQCMNFSYIVYEEKLTFRRDWLPPTLTQLYIRCRYHHNCKDDYVLPFKSFPSSLTKLQIISHESLPAYQLLRSLANSCLETLVVLCWDWYQPPPMASTDVPDLHLPHTLTTLYLTSPSHLRLCGWDKFIRRMSPESRLRTLFMDRDDRQVETEF